MSTPAERLTALGIVLPPPPRPAGAYVAVARAGTIAWVAGQIVLENGAIASPGLVDRDVAPDVAKTVARKAALQALSALAHELGSLDRVRRIVRVGVFVASSPGFDRQHEVANAATEVLIEIFGDAGKPSRYAVGVAALPLNAPVEVEVVAETWS